MLSIIYYSIITLQKCNKNFHILQNSTTQSLVRNNQILPLSQAIASVYILSAYFGFPSLHSRLV
jgi:hypothetical protein